MGSRYPTVRLREVLTRAEEWATIEPEQRYRQVTVRLWGKGLVQRDEVTGVEIAADRRLVVRTGQFILSRIDARNGAFGLVPASLDGAVVSTDFPVFSPHPERLLPQYVAWLSRTAGFTELCKRASEGTTNRVRLKEDRFLASEIPLPPLDEQRRIVARVEQLAAKIEEGRTLRAEGVAQASTLVASLHRNAAGDRRLRLGDMLELHERQDPVVPGTSYPQVGVRAYGQGLFAKRAVEGEETTYRAFNRLYEGAIVLSQVKGWEGAIAVCPSALTNWYVSPEYRTFRCLPGRADPWYMSVLVASPWFWTKLRTLTRGVGGRRERTRPEAFLSLELPMPSEEQQRKLLPALERLATLQHLQSYSIAEFNALLPSILDRVFDQVL